jgi:hypothetical protein
VLLTGLAGGKAWSEAACFIVCSGLRM